jgi:hypothetical protein
MADPDDKLMDMVDALVEDLTAAVAAGEFSLEFTPAWSDDALTVLDDAALTSPQLLAIDSAEELPEASGQSSVPIEEFEILLVAQRKFAKEGGGTLTEAERKTACRSMSAMASEIARHCRKTTILDCTCVSVKRETAKNIDRYHNEGLYLAPILTTWRRMYDDE